MLADRGTSWTCTTPQELVSGGLQGGASSMLVVGSCARVGEPAGPRTKSSALAPTPPCWSCGHGRAGRDHHDLRARVGFGRRHGGSARCRRERRAPGLPPCGEGLAWAAAAIPGGVGGCRRHSGHRRRNTADYAPCRTATCRLLPESARMASHTTFSGARASPTRPARGTTDPATAPLASGGRDTERRSEQCERWRGVRALSWRYRCFATASLTPCGRLPATPIPGSH